MAKSASELVEWAEGNITDQDKDCWVLGFDTGHYGDSIEKWPNKASVLQECDKLIKQLKEMSTPKISVIAINPGPKSKTKWHLNVVYPQITEEQSIELAKLIDTYLKNKL